MKKIKYQGGLTKLICCKLGERNKRHFCREVLKQDCLIECVNKLYTGAKIPIDVASFSSATDFPEQVLSILSFLRHIGKPLLWTVYTDGSHNEYEIKLLEAGLDFVNVVRYPWDENIELKVKLSAVVKSYSSVLIDYSQKHPLGKKLFCFLNHDIEIPTLFLDADIIFYKRANLLWNLLNEHCAGWFLPDTAWGCLDPRYLEYAQLELYQINTGFIFSKSNLKEYFAGLEFLKSLKGDFNYFSEQTTLHILLKKNNFFPLDPRIFVLNSDDQFDFDYLNQRQNTALRHYTSPVRHKMWQRNWKWHLCIN